MQDAFVAQQARTETVDHGIHELAKPRTVKWTLRAKDKARHVIMVVRMIASGTALASRTCGKCHIQFAVEIEATKVEYLSQWHVPNVWWCGSRTAPSVRTTRTPERGHAEGPAVRRPREAEVRELPRREEPGHDAG